jgi:hypothetical protein
MTPGKGGDDKDNPLHFSGEIKDWLAFKEAIQSHADARDTTMMILLLLFLQKQSLAFAVYLFCSSRQDGR